MLLIHRVRRNGRVDLLILLAEENIERIREYDPAEILWPSLGPEVAPRMPQTIAITFCSAKEQDEITRMSATDPDWKEKAFKTFSRGFRFQPERGDHDFGPIPLGKPTEGTKQ